MLRRGAGFAGKKLPQQVKHAPRKVPLALNDFQKKIYPQVEQEHTEEGFPILKLMPSNRNMFSKRRVETIKRRSGQYSHVIRENLMKEDQDWPSVWPVAKTFSPSAVPLPLRQSYEENNKLPRAKYANTELQKAVNFLHLTPPAIERHCEALRGFCSDWPSGLETDDQVRSHYPVTYVTRDYVHSSSTLRDPRARKVDLQINIDDLKLNHRDQDKLIRLAAHRYNKETNLITIPVTDCPSKIQNKDYADYLLTALYFESMKHDKWEDDKPECDWERFYWEKSESKLKLKTYAANLNINDEVIEKGVGEPVIEQYKESLETLYREENHESLEAYRLSVEKLLGLDNKNELQA